MQDSPKAGCTLCRSDCCQYTSNFSRKPGWTGLLGIWVWDWPICNSQRTAVIRKVPKCSAWVIAANQAVKHWKYPVKFTGEMITGFGSFISCSIRQVFVDLVLTNPKSKHSGTCMQALPLHEAFQNRSKRAWIHCKNYFNALVISMQDICKCKHIIGQLMESNVLAALWKPWCG